MCSLVNMQILKKILNKIRCAVNKDCCMDERLLFNSMLIDILRLYYTSMVAIKIRYAVNKDCMDELMLLGNILAYMTFQ